MMKPMNGLRELHAAARNSIASPFALDKLAAFQEQPQK